MKELRPVGIYRRDSASYSIATKTSGTSLIHISGQVPVSGDGETVSPGDISAQCRQVFDNLRSIVSDAGGTLADICRLQTFLVRREDIAEVAKLRGEYFTAPYPACTSVVVAGLGNPNWLIEVEATAVFESSESD